MKNKINMRRPTGISILITWQILVVIYSIVNLVMLINVVSVGGTVFGISEPSDLRLFFIIIVLINSISLVGIYQGFNWGRWVYILSLIIILILKMFRTIYTVQKNSFYYFVNHFSNYNEVSLLLINLFIVYYLLTNKKIIKYFSYITSLKK